MPQTRRFLVFDVCLATTAAMALLSCSSKTDECNPTCFETQSTARLTSGAVTLTLPAGDTETYLPGAECESQFATTTLPSASAESPAAPFLVCTGGSRTFSITDNVFKDLSRMMSHYRVAGDIAAATISVASSAPCSVWVAQKMTVDVSDAVGKVTDQWGAVSDDYLRRMNVRLTAVPLGDAGCAGTSMSVDLVVEQAASDVVTTKHFCGCL